MKRKRKKSQSVIEYTLLMAIAVAALAAVAYFMVDLSDGPFADHFRQVRLRIIGR